MKKREKKRKRERERERESSQAIKRQNYIMLYTDSTESLKSALNYFLS